MPKRPMPNHPLWPETGFLRERDFIGEGKAFPFGKSTWWEGVAAGRFPKPVKLGPRISAWRVEIIRALIEEMSRSTEPTITSTGTAVPPGGRPVR